MENKKLRVYHVGGWISYSRWLDNVLPVQDVESADLVFFLGGEDVNPAIYGERKHPQTQISEARDRKELEIYREAVTLGKPILGVCRGSQFICANQPGGKLVQHQPNPHSRHKIMTADGRELTITSTHHQAMYPFNMPKEDYKILGWTDGMLAFHEGQDQEELYPEKECEIVYFPNTKCLGIQGHPEMMPPTHETCLYLKGMVDQLLKNEL